MMNLALPPSHFPAIEPLKILFDNNPSLYTYPGIALSPTLALPAELNVYNAEYEYHTKVVPTVTPPFRAAPPHPPPVLHQHSYYPSPAPNAPAVRHNPSANMSQPFHVTPGSARNNPLTFKCLRADSLSSFQEHFTSHLAHAHAAHAHAAQTQAVIKYLIHVPCHIHRGKDFPTFPLLIHYHTTDCFRFTASDHVCLESARACPRHVKKPRRHRHYK